MKKETLGKLRGKFLFYSPGLRESRGKGDET